MKNETQKDKQKSERQKFQARYESAQKKLKDDTDERRISPLTRKQKLRRAISRGDLYWTPGCGLILSIKDE